MKPITSFLKRLVFLATGIGIVAPTVSHAYLEYYGMHTGPNRFIPDSALALTESNLSMVWPTTPDPNAPSPVPGLTNAQWVAEDIVSKGNQGVLTVLHLGFVLAGIDPSNYATMRGYIRDWAATLKDKLAMPYVYAVLGLDDSNCRYYNFTVPQKTEKRTRQNVNAWLRRHFRKVTFRGHVLNVNRWGQGGTNPFCGPITPDKFGLSGETVVFVYDYRQDGTQSCTQLGNPMPTEANSSASLIIGDIDSMIVDLKQTRMKNRPIIYVASSFRTFTCMPNAAADTNVACKMSDLWSRLRAEPLATQAERDIQAFMLFNWHDECSTFHWVGIENSAPFKAAAQWVGQNKNGTGEY